MCTAGCGELMIDRVRVTYSDSQFVGSVATLTCDIVSADIVNEQRTCTMDQGWILNGPEITCIRTYVTRYYYCITMSILCSDSVSRVSSNTHCDTCWDTSRTNVQSCRGIPSGLDC